MSCWDTLGIDRTDDATVIKRAYAARLKHTKPDEDPAGFSRLHAAYKQALVTAKRASPARRQDQEPRTSARVSQIQTPEPLSEPSPIAEMSIPELAPPLQPMPTEWAQTSLAKQEPIAQPPHPTGQRADRETEHDSAIREPVAEKTAAPDRELISGQELAIIEQDEEDPQVAWDRLTEAVDALLLDIDRANRIESWQFIDGEHVLYDIQFKPEFSRFLFLRLRDHPEIKQPVIAYLNQVFRWTDQRDSLEIDYGYEDIERILGARSPSRSLLWICEKKHRGPMVFGNYYARIFATLLDLILLMFVYKAFMKASFMPLGDNAFFGAIWLFLIVAPLLEATSLQGTPAKVLFGLKVVSARGTQLNIFQSALRNIIFGVSTALFKITIWINLFIRDGRLLHDLFSRTVVIKRYS